MKRLHMTLLDTDTVQPYQISEVLWRVPEADLDAFLGAHPLYTVKVRGSTDLPCNVFPTSTFQHCLSAYRMYVKIRCISDNYD